MKTIFFICSLLMMAANPPNYKLRKGILYKDKEEIGTVSGEAGLTKYVDLSFKDLTGHEVLTIRQGSFKPSYPNHQNILWNEFNFKQYNIRFLLSCEMAYLNEEKVIKHELANRGVEIFSDGFKLEEVRALLEQDYSDQLMGDTLQYKKEVDFYQSTLNGGLVERDYSAGISFKPIPQMNQMYWINQGANLKSEPYEIGRLAIINTSTPMERKTEILIMKRLKEPVMRNGEATEFIEAGYILLDAFPSLFTYQDGIDHRDINFNSQQPVEQIYTEAVKYMMLKKYL